MTIIPSEKSGSWPSPAVTVSMRTSTTIKSKGSSSSTKFKSDGINTLGLTDLNPDRTEAPTVDIVAVHGLNSTPQKCWAKDGVIWLRDFLSVALPTARILTFGYNSNVVIDASRARVRDHARNLLEALKDERKGDESRPLIFICHSLGGIVVKQALVLADQRHMSIRKSTYGICFMGTPHRGSDAAAWGRIAANIARAAFLNPKTHLLASLKEKSQELLDLSEDFGSLLPQLQIVNCIEMKETPLVKFMGATITKSLIVDRFSATLGVGEVPLCLNTDHRKICQFSSPDDPSFKAVFGKLEDLVKDAPGVIADRYRPLKTERPPLFVVPFVRNPEFVERGTILQDIDETLTLQVNRQPRAALWGLGGIGKTTLAVEFCYRMKEQKGISVFWAHGSSEESYQASCHEILQQASVKIPKAGDDSVMVVLQKWLESPESGNWTLVIDNLDNLDVAFRQWIPKQRGQILFTSRDKRIVGHQDYGVSTGSGIGVSRMNDEEASVTLLRLLGRREGLETSEEILVQELLALLDNLPLAIAQAAAFMRNTSISLHEYCGLFRESENNQQELLKERIPSTTIDGSSRAVMTTWSVTISRIETENPLAVRLMKFMSLLSVEDIRPSLVKASSNFNKESELSLVKAFGLLTSFAMIDRLESSSYRMHRLVGFWTREQMDVETTEENLSHLFDIILEAVPDDLETRRDLEKYAYLTVHGMAAISNARRTSNEYKLCMVSMFEIALGKLFVNFGQYNKALELFLRAADALEQTFGLEYELTLAVYHFIGRCYKDMREYTTALRWYQKALDGEEKTLGKEDPSVMETVSSMANVFRLQEKHTEALEWYQRSLDGMEKANGRDHLDTLLVVNGMAAALDEQGNHEKAMELYQRSLDGLEALLGKGDPTVVAVGSNIGYLYANLGRDDKALEYFQHSLNVCEKSLGKEHPETLTVVHNMAVVFARIGKDEKALEYFQRALDGYVKVHGHGSKTAICAKQDMEEFINMRAKDSSPILR